MNANSEKGQWSDAFVSQLQDSSPIIFMGVNANSEGDETMAEVKASGYTATVLMSDDPKLFRLPDFRTKRCMLHFSFYMPTFTGRSFSTNELTSWARNVLNDTNYPDMQADDLQFLCSSPEDEIFRMKLIFRWEAALDSIHLVTFVHNLDKAVIQRGAHY